MFRSFNIGYFSYRYAITIVGYKLIVLQLRFRIKCSSIKKTLSENHTPLFTEATTLNSIDFTLTNRYGQETMHMHLKLHIMLLT